MATKSTKKAPPTKAKTVKSKVKKTTVAAHPAYKEMIAAAIKELKERNGSSRQALKKFIIEHYKLTSTPTFESKFNLALKRGVKTEEFVQPKGPQGSVKINKAKPAPSTPLKNVTNTAAKVTKQPKAAAPAKKPVAKAKVSAKKGAAAKKPTAKRATK